jgi:hypothetical protein
MEVIQVEMVYDTTILNTGRGRTPIAWKIRKPMETAATMLSK